MIETVAVVVSILSLVLNFSIGLFIGTTRTEIAALRSQVQELRSLFMAHITQR